MAKQQSTFFQFVPNSLLRALYSTGGFGICYLVGVENQLLFIAGGMSFLFLGIYADHSWHKSRRDKKQDHELAVKNARDSLASSNDNSPDDIDLLLSEACRLEREGEHRKAHEAFAEIIKVLSPDHEHYRYIENSLAQLEERVQAQ